MKLSLSISSKNVTKQTKTKKKYLPYLRIIYRRLQKYSKNPAIITNYFIFTPTMPPSRGDNVILESWTVKTDKVAMRDWHSGSLIRILTYAMVSNLLIRLRPSWKSLFITIITD